MKYFYIIIVIFIINNDTIQASQNNVHLKQTFSTHSQKETIKNGQFVQQQQPQQEQKQEQQQQQRRPRYSPFYENNEETTEIYDFIIIGSGSSGSVLASRLSEEKSWKILLLEVGEEPNFFTEIPAIAPLFQFTNLNWNYLAEPQENVALGMIDKRMAWPRGKALGGSTIINYMIHVRGNEQDYNKWANLGNPGWSYNQTLQYFKKLENSQIKKQDIPYHYQNGPTNVETTYRTKSGYAFVEACKQTGLPYVDYNGKTQLGVSFVHGTLRNGRRCSTEKAYLRPAKQRKNLEILTKSRVVKILINPITKQAYGVTYIRNKQIFRVKTRKEVILSAGALNSPQLLMLSGIGPKEHLDSLDIQTIQDLPVGQKLYDHLTFVGLVFTVNQTITSDQKLIQDPHTFLQFILNGKGPLTSLGGVEALAYLNTKNQSYPDIELIFISGSMHTDKGVYYRKTFRITDEIYDKIWKPLEDKQAFSILPMLLHPKSFGHIKLKSTNPYHWPKFYGNYFTDPQNDDIKTFIASIRFVQNLIKQPAFQRFNTKQHKTPLPGCQHFEYDSDQYWECCLRHLATTLHHQVATCKMGPKTDPEAIVDANLNVYGIANLRVVDTSIIPIPLAAHTNIPAIMIGEKAADLIKNYYRL